MAALLALLSSLIWGTGDFLGGRASRRWGALRVLAWSQLGTTVMLWGVVAGAVLAFGVAFDARAVALGALGGVAGVIGIAAFYRALAIGPMSVVPPIAAAGVALPVAVGLATGEPPTNLVMVGLAVAVVGVVLASIGEGVPGDDAEAATRVTPTTLALCLVAAVGFALIFVALDAAAGTSVSTALQATAGVRIGSLLTIALAIVAMRAAPWREVGPRDVAGFVGIGVLDTSANLLFAIAAGLGELEIVAVLGSLYPAVTSALACWVMGERLGRVQLAGVTCAFAGIALLAAQ